jgi:hypothetical protein
MEKNAKLKSIFVALIIITVRTAFFVFARQGGRGNPLVWDLLREEYY